MPRYFLVFAYRAIVLQISARMTQDSDVLRRMPVPVTFPPHGLAVIESRHGEGFFMDWRKDDFNKLLVVVEGRGELQLKGRSLRLEAPGLAVVPRNVSHKIADDPQQPLWLYGLCLGGVVFPGEELLRRVFHRASLIRDSGLTSRAVTTFRRMLFETRSPSCESPDYQLSMATQLLVDILRLGEREALGSESHARVRAYIDELRQTFWMEDNVDRVAARLGLSRRRFTQLFRLEAGVSWLDQVRELRMAHAALLLRETLLPIKSVAFECGCNNLAHFYRLFARTHHTSPQALRHGKGKPRL